FDAFSSREPVSTSLEDALAYSNRGCIEKFIAHVFDAVRQNKTGAALGAAPVERMSPNSVNEAGACRLFQCCGERAIFSAISAAQFADPGQVILRLIAVALFELP